jgi:SET domain
MTSCDEPAEHHLVVAFNYVGNSIPAGFSAQYISLSVTPNLYSDIVKSSIDFLLMTSRMHHGCCPMLPLLLILVLPHDVSGFLISRRILLSSNFKKIALPSLYLTNHPWRFSHRIELNLPCLSAESNADNSIYIPDISREMQQLMHELLASEECEGIDATAIGFRCTDCRRGVFARESFAPGEYILAIPFTSTLLVHESFSGEEEPSDIQLGYHFWTTFFQRNDPGDEHLKGPWWNTYLDCLPKQNSSQFTPTPEFWTEDAIDAIEVPMLVQEMKRRQQAVNDTIRQYHPNATSGMHEKLCNDLLFAAWLVRSRGFTTVKTRSQSSCQLGGTVARRRTVLIPYMDFINHESNDLFVNAEIDVVESKSDEESFFALTCRRPIAVGDEILIQYGTGQENTLDLFSKYGFYTADSINIYDESFFLDSFDGNNIWTSSIENDEHVLQTKIVSDDMKSALKLRLHLKRIEERVKRQLSRFSKEYRANCN